LRSAAQVISYELSLSTALATFIPIVGSLNFHGLVDAQEKVWLLLPLLPTALILGVVVLAETNRPPFDLPEAEAELVAGYFVEYNSAGFTMFFIGEYAQILLMCALYTYLLGGGLL